VKCPLAIELSDNPAEVFADTTVRISRLDQGSNVPPDASCS